MTVGFGIAYWWSTPVDSVSMVRFTNVVGAYCVIAWSLQYDAGRLRKAEQTATDASLVDPLTGVSNRRAFEADLRAALTEGGKPHDPATLPALLLVDVDNFKDVNSRYGHHGGDALLQWIAMRMRDAAGADGQAYRIGGDEFAVICPSGGIETAGRVAERCRSAVLKSGEDLAESYGHIPVSASLGYTSLDQGLSTTDAMARADMALQASKDGGKNAVTAASWSLSAAG